MRGVGTSSVCDEMRLHAAIGEVYQVEPRRARGKGEVNDADKVSVGNALVMSPQSNERTPKQTGIDLTVDTVCSSESEPGSCRSRSKAGKRKIDEKTARNYQDIKLQHK
jgi:hypothetical protein